MVLTGGFLRCRRSFALDDHFRLERRLAALGSRINPVNLRTRGHPVAPPGLEFVNDFRKAFRRQILVSCP